MIQEYHTIKAAAKILSVHPETVRRYIASGALPASKQGKWRVADEDLQKFIKGGNL